MKKTRYTESQIIKVLHEVVGLKRENSLSIISATPSPISRVRLRMFIHSKMLSKPESMV